MIETYTFKNRYIFWSSVLIPPLLLILLIWVPFDTGTFYLWIAAAIVFSLSIYSITKSLSKLVETGRTFEEKKTLKTGLIRPLMAIFIFIIAINIEYIAFISSDKNAKEISKRIQMQCNEKGMCPNIIDGWHFEGTIAKDGEYDQDYKKFVKEYDVKYPVEYLVSEDKKKFRIIVRHNFGSKFIITGGVNEELKELPGQEKSTGEQSGRISR